MIISTMSDDPMEEASFILDLKALSYGLDSANCFLFIIYFVVSMHDYLENFGRKPTWLESMFVTVFALIVGFAVYPVVTYVAYFFFLDYSHIIISYILFYLVGKKLEHPSEAIPTDVVTTAELLTPQPTNDPTGISEYSAIQLPNKLSNIINNNTDNEKIQTNSIGYPTSVNTITTAPQHRDHSSVFPSTSEYFTTTHLPNEFSGNITDNFDNEEAQTGDGNRYQTILSTVTTAIELLSQGRRNHLRNFPSASEYSVAQLPNEVSAISPNNNSDKNQATHIPDPTERIVEERESVRKMPTVKKRVQNNTPIYHPPKRRNRNVNSPLVNYTPDSSENDD